MSRFRLKSRGRSLVLEVGEPRIAAGLRPEDDGHPYTSWRKAKVEDLTPELLDFLRKR